MTKYRIRLKNGRVIGPFDKQQLIELKSKGHIKGDEESQIFPTGNWIPITQSDFYPALMDDDRTKVQNDDAPKEETFVIDLTKLRSKKQEKELAEFEDQKVSPAIEQLTETIRISSSEKKEVQKSSPVVVESPKREKTSNTIPNLVDPKNLSDETDESDKTRINPVAQEEIQWNLRLQKIADQKKILDEEKALKEEQEKKKYELELAQKRLAEEQDESTRFFNVNSQELIEVAEVEEVQLEIEIQKIEKRQKEEALKLQDEEEEEESGIFKRKKLLMVLGSLAILYVVLFPDEKPAQPKFKHLPPEIVFPVPFDQSDEVKSKVEFNRGLELFNEGSYPSIIKAGLNFKASYENNVDNNLALSYMLRAYSEELKHSSDKLTDGQTVFNVIQGKKPFLVLDPNGVIGLSLFYTEMKKNDAAVDIVQKYLKLNPKNVTEDLFAIYLQSLIKQGNIDLARQFYTALLKAPNKNRYSYKAIIDYLLLNQEDEKAMEFIDEAIKKFPKLVSFYLLKADLLAKNLNFKEVKDLLKKSESLIHEYNSLNLAKYLELKGIIASFEKKPKEATEFFQKSLEINDSEELRIKLADLSANEESTGDTDKLINDSKAVKFLLQAKEFFKKKNYELALSYASKASDASPGHIPSELFLAKVQLRLGLATQALKTMELLQSKYPNDKEITFGLIDFYIETYKFNDAKNRIQVVAASDLKDSWEFASASARLYHQMGDNLQAMSWFKNSIRMNPLNDSDIFLLSEILVKKSNFDAARLLLNKCIELDPVNTDYRIAYARLIYETQDDQSAVGYLLNLLPDFGEDPKILSEIAIFYYRAGKVKDFMETKEKLEKLHASDVSLYEFLIKAAMLDEKFLDIPPLVEKILTIEPGDLQQMMTAGRVLFENGKLVEAAKWFKRIQDKLPTYPKVLFYIAKIDFLAGDLEAARKKILEDIKVNGENDIDDVFLAQIHVAKSEFVEAENLFKKAQKLNPKSYDAIVGLADISTKRNNHDLALDLYRRALKIKTDEPIIHKKIGDVYRQLGQGTLAIDAYKLYLEMDPDSPHRSNLEAYINLMK